MTLSKKDHVFLIYIPKRDINKQGRHSLIEKFMYLKSKSKPCLVKNFTLIQIATSYQTN